MEVTMSTKKILIVGNKLSRSLTQTIREAVKKTVNIFVPDGPTAKCTPTTILGDATHTVSPADLVIVDESTIIPEMIWKKIGLSTKPRRLREIPSMKHRLWTYAVLDGSGEKGIIISRTRHLKDAKPVISKFKEPILIGLHAGGANETNSI
jgi:hypothetical protein